MFLVKPNTWRLVLRILTWLSWLSTGLKRPVELEVKAMSTILAAAKIEQPAVGPNRASRRPKPPFTLDGKPFRMSVSPVASHTLTPGGNGIIVAVHRLV